MKKAKRKANKSRARSRLVHKSRKMHLTETANSKRQRLFGPSSHRLPSRIT